MLEQLLTEIKKGTTTSPITLAERLNTTPQMVEAMLDSLERMGYLRSISTECADGTCGGCPVSGLCATNNPKHPRVRVLTEKIR